MLKINKTVNISGNITIDNQVVVHMSASLCTNGTTNSNINKNIANQELYNKNKVAVRADMAEFEKEVYKVEDELTTGSTIEHTPNNVKSLKEKAGE